MSIDQLIADITSGGFAQYEEAGLVDYISLRGWIKSELKRFGNNIMIMGETIMHVQNNRAKLPENFWQIYLGVNCEPAGYVIEGDKNAVQNSLFFKERLEGTMEWDNMNESYVGKDFTYVREDVVFKNAKVSMYYKNPQFLRLKPGFNKSVCAPGCMNVRDLVVDQRVDTIDIVGDYINTNYKEGVIYMQYRGLPADEDGNIIIPETQHNRLQEYLLYYCRMRILEDVVTAKDDDAGNLLTYYAGRTRETFGLAMTELKFTGLGKGWAAVMRNKQRKQTLKYDIMLPRI